MRFLSVFVSTIVGAFVCLGAGPPLPTKTPAASIDGCAETPPGEGQVFIRRDLERFISVFKTAESDDAWWISDYFLDFIEDNSCLFLSVMKEHPDAFESWLAKLDWNSFVDRGGCLDVECHRQRAISTLENVGLYNLRDKPDLRRMLERVIMRLKGIKVRHSPA
jgi:hypothetical protein